jgi:hypothetical protein
MRRDARSLVSFGAGALLMAVALAGLGAARLPPGWEEEPLDLLGYCRSAKGPQSSAYRPPRQDATAWRCGVWHNGVWALEPLDLDAACQWQRGDGARFEEVPSRRQEAESEVLCTV